MAEIKKILIANRGEIALRIMRTAKEMGIKTVAVYSEADKNAPHVLYADEAYLIGPPPSSQSYLDIKKIIDTAIKAKADAIHPGYGFLAENADFAKSVADAGLIFIGPSAYSIALMGDKLSAKQAVKKFGVPLVPGTDEPIKDLEEAKKIAKEIGFPLMIKAAAGGGGKGMRIVYEEKELENAIARAMSEALAAFGNQAVFIEKFIQNPKHIEFQILADSYGNVIHLYERECSIQRRHQKVIEEAPSPIMTPELREKMAQAAINVAKAAKYINAGTIEFIVDENRNYYFLEMNTRLQVEHPVTEMITGIDLVRQQILIAQGEKINTDIPEIRGHAIQLRVYAEDPQNNFLPDIGTLTHYETPKGPGVRVDDGVYQGMEIPVYYDPMISKLIVFAENRELAIERMKRVIDEYKIAGVKNTLPFGKFVMNHPEFVSGKFTTNFVKEHFSPEKLNGNLQDSEIEALSLWTKFFYDKENSVELVEPETPKVRLWKLKR